MPSLTKYTRGTVVRVETTFAVRTGVNLDGTPIYTPTDPTTVEFRTEAPDGEETTYAFPGPNVFKDDVGEYHAEITPDEKGKWLFRWVGTGTAAGADEGAFLIVDSLQDNFSFLVLPEDHDAVRSVLGITEADLEDWQIEQSTFAGQAEQRVKNRVSNWEEQLLDPDRLYALRLASAYATAALIAESYAKGGTIGNVYGPRIPERAANDWSTSAAYLWQRHEEWIAMAEAWDTVPEITYGLPMVKASGPSKANQRGPETIPPWTTGVLGRWRGWTV
jgi:hypothetical protein